MARATRRAPTGRRRFLAAAGALTATAVVALAATAPRTTTPPAGAAPPARENVAFWYQPIHAHTDLRPLGHPAVVVHFDPRVRARTEQLAAARIHQATGGAAYRYVQLYYLPAGRRSLGLRVGRHPHWAFCTSGATPATDTVDKPAAERWTLVDANERAVVTAFRAELARLRAWGWDGIFLDLAHRAFTEGTWDTTSTCPHRPVVPGRTEADAYAALVGIARSAGLQVMVNAGAPTGLPVPLRPDPADPACRAGDWPRCHGLDDVARAATWILHEGASNQSDDTDWSTDVAALAADEVADRRPTGARVVAFGAYRGDGVDPGPATVFQWAVMKLFAVPAALGTGTDRCGTPIGAPTDPGCNRGALAPAALVDTRLGPPLDPAPLRRDCAPDGAHCLWVRRYRDGLVALDNGTRPVRAAGIPVTADGGCVRLVDAVTGAAGRCVTTVDLTLEPDRAVVLQAAPPGA